MNREHWKAMLPVIQAFCEGKTIQSRDPYHDVNEEWGDDDEPTFGPSNWEYRIKPEPKLRPWRPEEVPVGAVVRPKKCPKQRSLIIEANDEDGAWIGSTQEYFTGEEMLNDWELLDGSPCGVSEVGE